MSQPNLRIISAGAGSGKTYRLTQEMVAMLRSGEVRASGIIATTFTKKAAAELQERVRTKLLEEGLKREADDLNNALIGTVHGLGVKLLKRFAYEAGVSPEVSIIAEEDTQILFNQSLSQVLTNERVRKMERLSERLGFTKNERAKTDWRKQLLQLTEIARNNDFSKEVLERSRDESFRSFRELLGEPIERSPEEWTALLKQHLSRAIEALENNADETKTTRTATDELKKARTTLNNLHELPWHQWVKIGKIKVGAKSRDDVKELTDFAKSHDCNQQFHDDIKAVTDNLFDLAVAALNEYQDYKKSRGLIDYTDMEALIRELLRKPVVREVLSEELDLLMVDEFQDTSPLQLEIFWQMTQFAKQSIWVGDPKQSIYGFRGAEPELMRAVIEETGGIRPKNIQRFSWRSREDIVNATNVIFTEAFNDIPPEQVRLEAKRTGASEMEDAATDPRAAELGPALHHWHLVADDPKFRYNKEWFGNALARATKTLLERQPVVFDKHQKVYRSLVPGDIAILCRSNYACADVAQSLHKVGIRAALARTGLLATTEAKFIVACLKFILNQYDSLSIATILLLSNSMDLSEIIESRLDHLEEYEGRAVEHKWAAENEFIKGLNRWRRLVEEYSSAEILNLLLDDMDLRRIIAGWGSAEQRLGNVDELRALALTYEENCNRLHTAASLAGFLIYLDQIERDEKDRQASGEGREAVNVLTYHRSKGLEWPVVILHGLNQKLRENTLGFNLISERDKIDPTDILGGRWLRYWLNPYADQKSGTNLMDRLDVHPANARALAAAKGEEARLLYVGITRARDYLIFPTRPKEHTTWLNRVWHGDDKTPTLDPDSDQSQWLWQNEHLEIATQSFAYPVNFPENPPVAERTEFLEPRAGRQDHPDYHIDADAGEWRKQVRHKCTRSYSYYQEVAGTDEPESEQRAAELLKQFIGADHADYTPEVRDEIAEGLRGRLNIGEELPTAELLDRSEHFYAYLSHQFGAGQTERNFHLRYHYRGAQLFQTYLDLLLHTDREIVLVQHSSFSGPADKCAKKCKDLAAWLRFSARGLERIYPAKRVRTLIHFPKSGQLIEVQTSFKKTTPAEQQMRLSI